MWGTEEEKRVFGELYPLFNGKSDERDYARGIKVIRRLAATGYVPAVFELGLAYFDHLGVHRDYKESFRLYLLAANEGYPSAEGGVGNYYASAYPKYDVCDPDPATAAAWWLKAAEHGNAGSQCNLAGYYLKGTYVKRDHVEAYVWASLAVHCSTIRFRSAEVFREQAASMLTEESSACADERIRLLKERLPLKWSDHLHYWRSLHTEARQN
ncbi:MAG: sel1 repeat family protein [Dehalococcoidia bacterium]|nr:sel1 repeat family protein [Dehalococcoidia bacterium]